MDTDNQINAVEDKIERGVRTVFNHEGLELKKTLMVSLGNLNPYYAEIQIDSASPNSFLKKDLLHELKIRGRFSKIEAVDEITKSISGLREYNKHHWKSLCEDSIERLGR